MALLDSGFSRKVVGPLLCDVASFTDPNANVAGDGLPLSSNLFEAFGALRSVALTIAIGRVKLALLDEKLRDALPTLEFTASRGSCRSHLSGSAGSGLATVLSPGKGHR